jgi:hypothetical protein
MYQYGPGEFFFGWSWLAAVGVIILLGISLVPAIFFFLNLQNLLSRVSPANQGMSPGLVWLNFIPVFNLGWFIYTVIKVKDSVSAEFRSRGWPLDGDLGYNVGLAAGILWIASVFVGWIPFIGWLLPIGALVCWIIYWLKTADLKQRLEPAPPWRRNAAYPPAYPGTYPPAMPPYSAGYPQPYAPPATPGVPAAPVAAEASSAAPPAQEEAGAEGALAVAAAGEVAAAVIDDAGEAEKLCAACGSKVDPEDRFCRTCGLPLPQ